VVWIETPDDTHRDLVRLGLEAGAPLVLCEKSIAFDSTEGVEVLRHCNEAQPAQQVAFIDHYLLFELVRRLHAHAAAWLGKVRQVQVTLLESQGVPPHQVRAHRNGMTNFYHHVVALAGLWFDLKDLVPSEAGWAQHPEARVPDTYREARFTNARNGAHVLEGAVGKYLRQPAKQIHVLGTRGRARIDRDRNELHVTGADGRSFVVPGSKGDTGYGELAKALATGAPLPPLLTPAQALQVLRLVEQAQARARRLPLYEEEIAPLTA
jgi:predicted dehydrogenase